jgi:hypothetical protein
MSSQQQFLTTLHVDGFGNVGVFDKQDGGDVTTTPVKHRPGGSKVEVIYPSLPVYGTITLERVYDNEFRNDQVTIANLRKLVGSGKCTVTEQPLDANLNAFGTPRTFTGLLTAVKDGGVDSTSEAARLWTVDIDITTTAN